MFNDIGTQREFDGETEIIWLNGASIDHLKSSSGEGDYAAEWRRRPGIDLRRYMPKLWCANGKVRVIECLEITSDAGPVQQANDLCQTSQ